MHCIVIFCFISVDGSFQEEAAEENSEKPKKADQFGCTWRYGTCQWSLVVWFFMGRAMLPGSPSRWRLLRFSKVEFVSSIQYKCDLWYSYAFRACSIKSLLQPAIKG